MARNTGPLGAADVKRAKEAGLTIRDRSQLMRTFDNFPREVRLALAHSDNDWSVEQIHLAMKGGNAVNRGKGMTPADIVILIGENDERRRKIA